MTARSRLRRPDYPGYLRTLGVVAWLMCFGMTWAACERRERPIAVGSVLEMCWECNTERCWEIPCEPTASPASAEIAL